MTGKQFKARLLKLGIKQKDLAAAAGVQPPSIHDWFVHGVPPRRARAVSEFTGIPLDELCPDIFGGLV